MLLQSVYRVLYFLYLVVKKDNCPIHYCSCLLVETRYSNVSFFSTLHEMPARTSDEKGVHLSVRPSVKRVHCDKME